MKMEHMLGELPEWGRQQKPLTAAAYNRYDAVLQVVDGDCEGDAPHAELFAACARRRRDAKEDAPPPVVTLPGGTAVCRLRWRADEDAFCRLQRTRKALSPLLAQSPPKLALDVRCRGAAADVLYAALVGAARLPHGKAKLPTLTLAAAGNVAPFAAAAAEANTTARALTLLPPNELTPAVFVRLARQLAKLHGFGVAVYDATKLRRLGAGAMLAVGRGGTPPALVRLRYRPRAARRLALVGKGVCFDTGGINVKPARHMRGMSKDMAGAAAALAALVGAARLRLPTGVDVWLALAENNIGPSAYRPDEVITAHNGKRVEIVHTDAEGRMILADALSLAGGEKPAALISLATLTGTMHVALGERMSGFFCEDDDWRRRALAAAAESGERLCWFPMPDDYRAALDSDVADIKQCAEAGEADHILAALFLREFVPAAPPWMHVDLSAASCEGGLGAAPGAVTGFGATWLLALLRGLA